MLHQHLPLPAIPSSATVSHPPSRPLIQHYRRHGRRVGATWLLLYPQDGLWHASSLCTRARRDLTRHPPVGTYQFIDLRPLPLRLLLGGYRAMRRTLHRACL